MADLLVIVDGGTVVRIEDYEHNEILLEDFDYCVWDKDLLATGEVRAQCLTCDDQCSHFLAAKGEGKIIDG